MNADKIKALGRELDQAKWELPNRFQLTPEMLKASEEEQARLAAAAALPFGNSLSPRDMERARSVTIAEHLQSTLDVVQKGINTVLMSGGDHLSRLLIAKRELSHQLAERYAIIGRYDLAVEVEPDDLYRVHYQTILETVWSDDGPCACDPHRGSGDYSNLEVPSVFVKEEIFSIRLGKPAFLIGCSKCPVLSVVETLPDGLQQQRALRARAHQLVSNLSLDDAAKTLKARNHTTAQLLK